MLYIFIYINRRVHCSLWGEYVDKFLQYHEGHDTKTPAILIIQHCKQRKYMGEILLQLVSNHFLIFNDICTVVLIILFM